MSAGCRCGCGRLDHPLAAVVVGSSEPLVTLAERHGVSVSTVKRALHGVQHLTDLSGFTEEQALNAYWQICSYCDSEDDITLCQRCGEPACGDHGIMTVIGVTCWPESECASHSPEVQEK